MDAVVLFLYTDQCLEILCHCRKIFGNCFSRKVRSLRVLKSLKIKSPSKTLLCVCFHVSVILQRIAHVCLRSVGQILSCAFACARLNPLVFAHNAASTLYNSYLIPMCMFICARSNKTDQIRKYRRGMTRPYERF